MSNIGVMHANLETSPIGTASRLSTPLKGIPVLTRTVRRLRQAKRLSALLVVCPPDQFDDVQALVSDTDVIIKKYEGPEYPTARMARVARKWALNSWRGGLGNTCYFDEHTHPAVCASIADQVQTDTVVSIPAEAPLIDPQLVDEMIEHYEEYADDVRMTFAQAPPGLVPTVFQVALLKELCKSGLAPGWVNSYRPDQPRYDMINVPACYRPPLAVQHASGRLASDTTRGMLLLDQALGANGENCTAAQVCEWLNHTHAHQAEPFPQEIHVELTTEDHMPNTQIRPRGQAVGQRQGMDLALFERLLSEVSDHDDALLVLGGFGEPLCHPQFDRILECCRAAEIFGLAIRTNGVALTPEIATQMITNDVDVVQFNIDAQSQAQYHAIHQADHFDTVINNLKQFEQQRAQHNVIKPIIAPSFCKAQDTFDDMDPFFDRWFREFGWVIIEGYSHYAGQFPDRRVMDMSPPVRIPCRQLRSRSTVLSDGRVTACDQDFRGLHIIGDLTNETLTDIWLGERAKTLREAHRAEVYDKHPLCVQCQEWHRP